MSRVVLAMICEYYYCFCGQMPLCFISPTKGFFARFSMSNTVISTCFALDVAEDRVEAL